MASLYERVEYMEKNQNILHHYYLLTGNYIEYIIIL